jgi:endo-1,4-beta-xylanase
MLRDNSKVIILLLLSVCFVGVTSCRKDEPPVVKTELQKKIDDYNQRNDGLKDYYTSADFFYMGSAITSSDIDNQEKVNLIKRHFNSITAENEMKWSSLQPTEGIFNYAGADRIVAFAQTNGMKVRGHTLCWHNQVPAWIFEDGAASASKELVLDRLRTHITAVMTHFKGKVYAWDVVNEAIDDGSATYRASLWYTICGEDYILEAFRAARAADPDAKLFYNDYSEVNPAKRDKIYDLLVKLKAQGIVDGIGMQAHWNVDYPSNSLLVDALDKYKSTGLEIQITELDVSVYTSDLAPASLYTAELEQKQDIAYGRFFGTFRDYRQNITGVTFWGLADNYTWLDNFPVTGRKNYPFLFDIYYKPKLAYFTVINF